MITTNITTLTGQQIHSLVQLAQIIGGETDHDPRPALIAATAAATLLGAEIPLDVDGALSDLATEISRTTAHWAESYVKAHPSDANSVPDATGDSTSGEAAEAPAA